MLSRNKIDDAVIYCSNGLVFFSFGPTRYFVLQHLFFSTKINIILSKTLQKHFCTYRIAFKMTWGEIQHPNFPLITLEMLNVVFSPTFWNF